MKPFGFSLVLAGLFGAVSFGSPAMSGPIAGLPTSQLNSMSTMPEEAQAGSHIVQVRFGRGGGGHRGGGMHRHHGVYRGGVANPVTGVSGPMGQGMKARCILPLFPKPGYNRLDLRMPERKKWRQ